MKVDSEEILSFQTTLSNSKTVTSKLKKDKNVFVMVEGK